MLRPIGLASEVKRAAPPIWASRAMPTCSHACGYKLANNGHVMRAIQAYLGRRNI
jgi:hypothetical protein